MPEIIALFSVLIPHLSATTTRQFQARDITDFDEETRRRTVRSRNRAPSTSYPGDYGGWRRS